MNTVLVTGATGYVGGRLAPLLLERGHAVRAMARSLNKIQARSWSRHEHCALVQADMFDQDSLRSALTGCDTAFYLVHSMSGHGKHSDFAAKDREAATNFLHAAEAAGVTRIIYLGGLGEDGPGLSEHLRSRAEVGRILQSGAVQTTWLRAAVILGSGSASFEIVRHLVDRLPVMITPRWVDTLCQPIAISDVLGYLVGCLETPATAGLVLDIGGPDRLTYRELFRLYAEEAGLRPRLILPVPVLTPALSAHWINLITPVPRALAAPLIEGLRNEVVCTDERILELVPLVRTPIRKALREALHRVQQADVATCCFDAGTACAPEWAACHDAPYAGATVLESGHSVTLDCTPSQAWKPVTHIGGDTGWYYGDTLWKVRGFLDKLVGGPGLRRGRRHPEELRPGDALDFWRVVDVDKEQRLLLVAEMRLPGEALLEFTLRPEKTGTRLFMRARFLPRGLGGLVYWWLMYPFHMLLFKNMLRGVARAAQAPILSGPAPVPPEGRS